MTDCKLYDQVESNEALSDTSEILRNFIGRYETLPELWNPTQFNYKNKNSRNMAYDKLLEILIQLKPGATRADVKRKINTLRCNYRKELKKILISKSTESSTDEIYMPSSWVFYALSFLGKFEQPVNSQNQGDKMTSEERSQDEELDEQSELAAPVASSSSIILPPQPQKKRRTVEPLSRQNELLNTACLFLEQPKQSQDNIPTIAKVWGEKLLTLDPQQRCLAEKAVNDVLFEATQGTLHRTSVKINENLGLVKCCSSPLPLAANHINSTSSEYRSSIKDE